ncbi:metalloregulator ArsR/SmtB family transcription factor [Gemmatimonas aurantiaca]|uniref:ArsR/SmtB family transcription factor n=1 Tax=Gemmatimonas aurantiaca TaxID=173480 RepID=UPI00301DF371
MHDTLSQTFSALADPTRRAILARLRQGEASVTELAEPFLGHMTLPGVTKHLKVLEKAGLVTKGREAQWRPCRLNPDPLKDVSAWMEDYRAFMEESLDRLGEYLKTLSGASAHASLNASPNAATGASPRETNDDCNS